MNGGLEMRIVTTDGKEFVVDKYNYNETFNKALIHEKEILDGRETEFKRINETIKEFNKKYNTLNINSIKYFISNKDIENVINANKNYRFNFDNIIDIYQKINIKEIRLKKPISFIKSISVIFIYKGNNTVVQCQTEDTFAEIALKFTKEVGININECNFYFNTSQIRNDCNLTLSDLHIQNLSSFDVFSKYNTKNARNFK